MPAVEITGLYGILDWPPKVSLPAVALAGALTRGGARVLQLRAKGASAGLRRRLAVEIAPVCAAAGVPFILNDDLELALELARSGVAISGVHLGREDLAALPEAGARLGELRRAGLCIGLSTHALSQVEEAAALGPDYLGFGPIFATRSKENADPSVGLASLREAVRSTELPMVAIGGIDLERARAVAETGVGAMAAIGATTGPSAAVVQARCAALVEAFAPAR